MIRWSRAAAAGVVCWVFLFVAAGNVAFSSERGEFVVHGVGSKSCREFVEEHHRGGWEPLVNSGWVNGYLTHFNRNAYKGADVAADTQRDDRDQWLLRYCERHPDEGLWSAVDALIDSLARE